MFRACRVPATFLPAVIMVASVLAGCAAAPPEESLPGTVWALRSAAARKNAMGDLDTRLSPAGESVELTLPTEDVRTALQEDSPGVCVGGNVWTRPSSEDSARDAALAADEDALLEFSVAARDARSVPLVTGAAHSEPGEVRFALSGRTEQVGDAVWWEFRRLPLRD